MSGPNQSPPAALKILKDFDLRSLRILVVDDQPDTLQMILRMLKALGIVETFSVQDGREALQFIEATPGMLDMVFCDWNMPNVSGLDVLKELHVKYPNIRFVMVTARGDIDSVLIAKEAGVHGFIRKPFSLSELKSKIISVMNQGT